MNEAEARRMVKERAEWGGAPLCERCGYVMGTEWHHRKNRSQAGRWAPSNGLWLDSFCHRYVTHHPRISNQQGGWSVRSWQDPKLVPVLTARHGWVFLDDDGNLTPATPHEVAALGMGDAA